MRLDRMQQRERTVCAIKQRQITANISLKTPSNVLISNRSASAFDYCQSFESDIKCVKVCGSTGNIL